MPLFSQIRSYIQAYGRVAVIVGLLGLAGYFMLGGLFSGGQLPRSVNPILDPTATPEVAPPLMAVATPLPTPTPAAVLENVREIGSRVELMIDDYLFHFTRNTTFELHRPQPREVVLEFDKPWEGPVSTVGAGVIKDGDVYRWWYRGGGDDDQWAAYATSPDGINWTRPSLGLVEYGTSTDNNIIMDTSEAKNLHVFIDGNPLATDEDRYKAIGRTSVRVGRDRVDALVGFKSADGINWEPVQDEPILTAPRDTPQLDTHNVVFWDDLQQQYVAYLRGWARPGIRAIRRATSQDFINWTTPEFIETVGAYVAMGPLEHLYTNATTPYFRAPHIYLSFPKRFVPNRKFDEDWEYPGLSETVFMTSRDGITWDRKFLEPFINPGLDPNNWTERNLVVAPTVVQTGPEEVSIYYTENYRHDTVRARRATLRLDGFVSLHAPFQGGEVQTHPLVFEGGELVINYSTSVAGSIRIELQRAAGGSIPGFSLRSHDEIFGNEIERVVTWDGNSDISELAGEPVRLRILMKAADLYSIQFRPKSETAEEVETDESS